MVWRAIAGTTEASRVSAAIKATMIESIAMLTHGHSEQTDFWSDVYRGRTIAILNHYGRLHVYLDHMLQHHVVFADRVDARAWLMQRVDEEVMKDDASPPIVHVDAPSEAPRAAWRQQQIAVSLEF
jgi:hypothetical protein